MRAGTCAVCGGGGRGKTGGRWRRWLSVSYRCDQAVAGRRHGAVVDMHGWLSGSAVSAPCGRRRASPPDVLRKKSAAHASAASLYSIARPAAGPVAPTSVTNSQRPCHVQPRLDLVLGRVACTERRDAACCCRCSVVVDRSILTARSRCRHVWQTAALRRHPSS